MRLRAAMIWPAGVGSSTLVEVAARAVVRLAGPLTVVVCALLAARAAGHWFEARYLDDAAIALDPPQAAPEPPIDRKLGPRGLALAERNIFCSDCRGAPDGPSLPARSGDLVDTEAPLLLIATHLADPADASLATVINTSTQRHGAYGVGDVIPGIGPIASIGREQIVVHNEAKSRRERLRLGRTTERATAAAPAAASPSRSRGEASGFEALVESGVRKIDETHYELDSALVASVNANPMQVRGVRPVPAVINGKIQGVRLHGVRSGSLPQRLGLKNGDVVRSINGIDLSSPDAWLEAASRLRDLRSWTLDVERAGGGIELSYSVR